MALKKKVSGNNDRAAQLAYLKESAKDLSASAKKEAPQGYTTAADVIKTFGLKVGGEGKPGKTASTQAKLTRIGTGMTKGDPKKKQKPAMFVSFNFTCVGSTGKGQTPSSMVTIEERKTKDGIRGKDKALDDIIFTMQRCGIDTQGIKTPADLLEAIDTFNALNRSDKPVVSITLSSYQGAKGPGLNVRVNKLLEDFEEEEVEEDEDDESDTEDEDEGDEDSDDEGDDDDEEEPPKKSSKSGSAKSKSTKSKSKSDDEDDDESEDEDEDAEEDSDDEEEESEEDEVEYDEDDPSTWVGYECKAKPNGYTKTTKFEITEYIAKGKKLKIKDPKGKVVTVAVAVVEVV
jgi:hypothetical protein